MRNHEHPLGKKAKAIVREGSFHSFSHGETIIFLEITETYPKSGKYGQDYHFYEFFNERGNVDELVEGEFSWVEGEDSVANLTLDQLKSLGWFPTTERKESHYEDEFNRCDGLLLTKEKEL